MKRAQRIAAAAAAGSCGGRCAEARELAAQVDEGAEVLDRWAARVRELERQVAELQARLRVAEGLRRGLVA